MPSMTLHESTLGWVELAPQEGEDLTEDISPFKTVDDWEGDATILLTRGDIFGALHIYEEILKVYPHYTRAWYNRAVILASYVKDYRGALWAYDQALAIEPKNPDILHNKAKLLLDLGKYDEAEKGFIRVLQQKPGYGKSLMGLAIAYVNTGRFDEALRAVSLAERAKLSKDEKANMLSVKAIVLNNLGKSKQAIKAAKAALALNPKDDSLWETMGIAYYNIKKFREAVRCLNRAIQINAQNVSARQMKRDILDSLADLGITIYDEEPGL
jgi:tetratricopeptide (TPR) repeat protein